MTTKVPGPKNQTRPGQLRISQDVIYMTTKVPGPKNQTSPGTTRDIPGCYIHDYQSPRSKNPKKSLEKLVHIGMF